MIDAMRVCPSFSHPRVAKAVSSNDPNPDFDLLREVKEAAAPHPFLVGRKCDPSDGCRVPAYEAAEVLGMWKDVYSDYKMRMGRFDTSGNHDTSLDNFARFCQPQSATATFYLYQTALAVPGLLDFASGGFLSRHEFDSSSPPARGATLSTSAVHAPGSARKSSMDTLMGTFSKDSSALRLFLDAATTRENQK
eukprot:GHVU01155300.1.p1 GENE.GHVU01155300.1~~GHVU01155300.1.p1  ORF type:complete len:215 (-),score=24.49 GHVU01155300.1:173-751(-)